MSYKTILVHCDASKSVSHRLDVATDLAQRFGARLVGLHVRRRFETSIFLDGGFAMDVDYDREPQWKVPVVAETYVEEQELFPRDEENQPEWYRAKLREGAGS